MIKKTKTRIAITLTNEQAKQLEIMADFNNESKSVFLNRKIRQDYDWCFKNLIGAKEFIKKHQ